MTTNSELIERLRVLEQDHKPDGWPAIQMRDVTALLDTLEAQAKQIEALQADAGQGRERFEAFVKKNLGDIAVMDGGRYISPKINKYWLVWQEARKQGGAT